MRRRLASAGLAPRVETAIEIGPTRAIAGMMKLQSGGTSTTLTSIVRASASWKTCTLSSVSSVAAKTRKAPSRSSLRYARSSSRSEPSRASSSTSGRAFRATTCTSASAASRPSIFSSPTGPGADDEAAPPTQIQARHEERRLHEIPAARRVATTLERTVAHARTPSTHSGRVPAPARYRCTRSATSSAVWRTRTPRRLARCTPWRNCSRQPGIAADDGVDAAPRRSRRA